MAWCMICKKTHFWSLSRLPEKIRSCCHHRHFHSLSHHFEDRKNTFSEQSCKMKNKQKQPDLQCCSGSLNAVTSANLEIMLTIQHKVSANICEERQLLHKQMQSKNMSHAQAILLWAIKSLYESYR